MLCCLSLSICQPHSLARGRQTPQKQEEEAEEESEAPAETAGGETGGHTGTGVFQLRTSNHGDRRRRGLAVTRFNRVTWSSPATGVMETGI